MGYIALGASAFFLGVLFDLVALRPIPWVRQGLGIVAVMIHLYAFVAVSLAGPVLDIPIYLSVVGWLLAALGGFLLLYSLFLELPLAQVYAGTGAGDFLVTHGTYALTRHPGVLWYGMLLLGLLLAIRSQLLLLAAPLWFILDVAYVVIQDRYIFPKTLRGYDRYQQTTPMLFPTRASIIRCWHTLFLVRRLLKMESKTMEREVTGGHCRGAI